MILYQLPSGKSVWISVDKLLNLTHQDIQDFEASNHGTHTQNPFIELPKSSQEFKSLFEYDEDEEEEDDEDFTPDILSDGDDDPYIEVNFDNIPDE